MLSPRSKTGSNPAPYLRNANVLWNRFDLRDIAEMDFDEREKCKFELRPGDLLVCEGGEPGRSAVWEGQIKPCYYQKALHRLRPKSDKVDSRFLMFRLWLGGLSGEFSNSHSKTTIAHLPAVRLARLPIGLPSIQTQREIVRQLDREFSLVERARAAAEARLEAVDQLRDSILAQAFHADLGWRKRSLEDLADSDDAFADGPFGSNLKTEHYATSGARVIRLQNIGRAEFLDSDKAYVSFEHYRDLARHAVKSNDVIVAALGSGARPAGRACLIPDGLGLGLVKADCFRVRLPAETVDPLFLVYWLNSRENLDHVADSLRGATRPRFTLGMLRSTTVPAPSLDEQKKTAADVSKRLHAAATCRVQAEQELQLVRSFPGALLRRAFSGEL
jgi:type I restriction enzyme S subunit